MVSGGRLQLLLVAVAAAVVFAIAYLVSVHVFRAQDPEHEKGACVELGARLACPSKRGRGW
jgi:hypothetical protein